MGKYKFLTNRPEIDSKASEKLKEFDMVLSRAVKRQKNLLLKKYLISSGIVFVVALGGWYFLQKPFENIARYEKPIAEVLMKSDSAVHEDNSSTTEEPKIGQDYRTVEKINSDKIKRKQLKSNNEAQTPDKQNLTETETTKPESFEYQKNTFNQATPVNGFEHLYTYLNQSTLLPETFIINDEHKVIVSFKINKNGDVTDVHVVGNSNPKLDSIAMQSVLNMPEWHPATINGEPIQSEHSIPFFFNQKNQ